MSTADEHRWGGWFPLYAASFVLMLAAAAVLVLAARDLLRSLTALWISVGLSAAAIVANVAALVRSRRR